MSHNDKIRDSSTVSNPPLSIVLFEALGSRIIFDREKIVFGAFNIGCPLFPISEQPIERFVRHHIARVSVTEKPDTATPYVIGCIFPSRAYVMGELDKVDSWVPYFHIIYFQ